MPLENTIPRDTGRAPRARGRVLSVGRVTSALAALVISLFAMTAGAGASTAVPEPATGTALFSTIFTHGRVTVDGGSTLHYVKGGSGPAIVLMHGWPQTWWIWRNVMPELAKTHTVIAFDLPGLGDSTPQNGGYDKATTAKRIHQAVVKLGFNSVALLGHDLGALIAYPYARDFPNEVTKVGVMETPLAGFGLENLYGISFHFKFNMAPAPVPETILDNDDVPTYLGHMFGFSTHPELIDKTAYYQAYSSPTKRSSGYEYYRAFEADGVNNTANASRRLTQPVLALGGANSFGPGVADSFRLVANDVRQVIVPDSGHYIPEENPTFLSDCAKLFFGPPTTTPPPASLAACAP
ncbi:alpha/beta hydrolase [Sphaerisporangium sp. NPDC051011]|uniref:alpha/beta fold hydrolase n=1 Tax=Sphaerisporangium sp. NPDC051011 TaxID=3155792 RepID=UPI0033E55E1B